MMNEGRCPLTPALLQLLQAMANCGTREAKALAAALNVSSHTIRTYFQRIFHILGVHNRAEALLAALSHGWITLKSQHNETPKNPEDPRSGA